MSHSSEILLEAIPEAHEYSRLHLNGINIRSPKTDFFRRVYCILGLPIDAVTTDQVIEKLKAASVNEKRCFLSTPNLNFLVASQSDAEFRNSVIRSDVSVADGMPLVWIARLIGVPVRERVAGASMMERLRHERSSSLSVYFFGGPEGAAAQAANAINSQAGCMKCVGYRSPGYGSIEDMSDNKYISHINDCNPDFLVVAMGAKKGQAWIEHNFHRIRAPIVSHLGAVVNFFAGSISRAPSWMQDSGLEWLWRIKEEPALWKRYFKDGITLSGLFFKRIIPCMFFQRLNAARTENIAHAVVAMQTMGCGIKIMLAGKFNEHNLLPLRKAMTEAVRTPADIILDLHDLEYADSACIALFALLHGHQSKIGYELQLIGLSGKLKKVLRAHCAEYLAM